MLDLFKSMSVSKLRPFLLHGYSFELYLVLRQSENGKGLEELYESLSAPKPKKQTFDRYIKLLVFKGLIEISDGKDKRKRIVNLKQH